MEKGRRERGGRGKRECGRVKIEWKKDKREERKRERYRDRGGGKGEGGRGEREE